MIFGWLCRTETHLFVPSRLRPRLYCAPGDVVETLRDEYFSVEANHFGMLSDIANVEVWMEQILD